jgi:hypothetical protein
VPSTFLGVQKQQKLLTQKNPQQNTKAKREAKTPKAKHFFVGH